MLGARQLCNLLNKKSRITFPSVTFIGMLALPSILDIPVLQTGSVYPDLLCVDEAQDSTIAAALLMRRMCGPKTVIVVTQRLPTAPQRSFFGVAPPRRADADASCDLGDLRHRAFCRLVRYGWPLQKRTANF